MLCNVVVLQENIRDKLRGIPIDVSVEIVGGRRKRRQSSGPGLQPVLDAEASKPTRSVVCVCILFSLCDVSSYSVLFLKCENVVCRWSS